jgi:hypothetical protein
VIEIADAQVHIPRIVVDWRAAIRWHPQPELRASREQLLAKARR